MWWGGGRYRRAPEPARPPWCPGDGRLYVRPIDARSLLSTARERNPLPPGSGSVGVALVIAGASAYGFLVVAARALGTDEYAPLSVLWVLALVAGPGLFVPVEQEIARALAARAVRGEGGGPVVRRAAALALILLVGILLVGAAAGPLLTDQLFAGSWVLLVAWLLCLAAACAAHLARGVLSGLGRFNAYARIVGGESALRFLIALGLVAAGVHTVGPYGLAVAAGPLLAVALALWGQSRVLGPGPPAPWSEVTVALAWLLLGSVLSMALVNAGPIAVQLLAGEDQEHEAGRFLAGLVIARIPLFLFQAVQASLLPRLSELASTGRTEELRERLGRLVVLVGAIGVAGTIGAGLLGPTVLRVLFGGEFDLGSRSMALLGLGSGAFMVAALLAQATIALGGHRPMGMAWAAGVAALVLTTALSSDDLFLRVELGTVAGGVVALAAQAIVLRSRLRKGVAIDPGDLIEAIHDMPLEP